MSRAWGAERRPVLWDALPAGARETLSTIKFGDGIAKAMALLKSCSVPRPDIAVALQGNMYPTMQCVSAWQEIGDQEFRQLFSAIKNRILDFVLKIEAENPDAGEAAFNSNPVPPEKLQPLVNNFFGNVGNLAQSSHSFTQTANIGLDAQDLTRLVTELVEHLSELKLDPHQTKRAEAQIATLKTELEGSPDPVIVEQVGRTLRNILEGAIASLVATAAQPSVWHWVQHSLSAFGR
jgi:AbiTii